MLDTTREELFAGEFEALVNIVFCWKLYLLNALRARLIVASQYDPSGIVDRLVPYLAGSASIVVHSPQSQVSDLFRLIGLVFNSFDPYEIACS